MNTNKKGFTLIELLVVIVIIGILATISVATFSGYFKKARDAERQSNVSSVATIMKVLNATSETTNYGTLNINGTDVTIDGTDGLDDLNTVLAEQGFKMNAGKNGFSYVYAYDTAGDDFVIASCSEESLATGEVFAAGTPAGVSSIECTAENKVPTLKTTLDADFTGGAIHATF